MAKNIPFGGPKKIVPTKFWIFPLQRSHHMLKFSVLSTNKLRYHELSPGQPRGRLKTAPSNIEYPNSHKAAVVDSAVNSPRPNFQLLYKKPHQSGSTSAHVGRGSSSQLCDQKIGRKRFCSGWSWKARIIRRLQPTRSSLQKQRGVGAGKVEPAILLSLWICDSGHSPKTAPTLGWQAFVALWLARTMNKMSDSYISSILSTVERHFGLNTKSMSMVRRSS